MIAIELLREWNILLKLMWLNPFGSRLKCCYGIRRFIGYKSTIIGGPSSSCPDLV